MPKLAWRKRNDGAYVAKQEGFKLTVYRPPDRVAPHELAQFIVQTQDKALPIAIIGSGLAPDVTQGMRLAEGMANRFRRDAPAGRAQVMVVDDDPSVRDAIADALREDGYEVVEAASAEGALRRLERSRHPIVLVTDVNLGEGMSGLELAAEVSHLWPTVGILLMSCNAEELLANSTAAIAFLPKPFSADCLNERVAAIFAGMKLISSQ